MRVLILGGTTEASRLARLLAGDLRFEATLSLAGRTVAPRPQPIATRVGGFGGADGLADFLRQQKIEAVIDATHPYAAQISTNTVAACAQTNVPLASFVRPAWTAQPGDLWKVVPTGAIVRRDRRSELAPYEQQLLLPLALRLGARFPGHFIQQRALF